MSGFQPAISVTHESSTQEILLQRARNFVERSETEVDLSGTLFLTKQKFFSSVTLRRDFALEKATRARLALRLPLEVLCHRYYQRFGGTVGVPTLRHYATRLINECPRLGSPVNAFMFFPQASGIASAAREDAFSFEFVETWNPILGDCVLPCVDRAFSPSAAQRIRHRMGADFTELGYFYSLFHEIGHHYGAFRILGGRDPDIVLDSYSMDVVGELATDAYASLLAPEFPELGLITLLYRSFWFGQWGFEFGKDSACVAPDNDAWTGAYLWQKAVESGVIHGEAGRLELEESALGTLYENIASELDLLSHELKTRAPSIQTAAVRAWMSRSLKQDKKGAFLLPQSMRDAFVKCRGVPQLRRRSS